MSFLENSSYGLNNVWRYALTIILTWFVGSLIGSCLGIVLVPLFGLSLTVGTGYLLNIFIVFAIQLLLLFLSIRFIHKRDFFSIINMSKSNNSFLKRVRWILILKGMLLWILFLLILTLANFIIIPNEIYINPNWIMILSSIPILVIGLIIQTSFEEFFFRGYFNQGLNLLFKNKIFVILVGSLVFAIPHLSNGGVDTFLSFEILIETFLMGVIFTIFALLYEGLEFSIGIHFVNNLYVFIIGPTEGTFSTVPTILMNISNSLLSLLIPTIFMLLFIAILFIYKRKKISNILLN
ncbi:putative protease [Methanobrevibacter arboriphilus JCM 13429 = DSM 1125]|uniref:Putative protease n=1 Tax=Methanobrevibacter arboriphilus JCM 13429 = DSM 1125 TaxID=1300164 RepID=A0A1V6N566_METAZ|nr:CPBP family intramembrane glutamic endopeptidase [Methanobrevibacter arboriphilus]OQD59868.1 putative protease [Methanobrevibacter arboriphilus JCM 13429 = DSM 1125]